MLGSALDQEVNDGDQPMDGSRRLYPREDLIMWIRLHKELRELVLPWAAAVAVAAA